VPDRKVFEQSGKKDLHALEVCWSYRPRTVDQNDEISLVDALAFLDYGCVWIELALVNNLVSIRRLRSRSRLISLKKKFYKKFAFFLAIFEFLEIFEFFSQFLIFFSQFLNFFRNF